MAARGNTGVFVTFEGGDGAGKSTQIRFLARLLEDAGREVVRLREPGGTAVGEALRAVVLDPAHEAMSDRAELLIYEAARAQIVDEVIRPALERGAVVLCDRFYDSTVAYQGCGRGSTAPSSTRRTGSPATGWCPTPRCFWWPPPRPCARAWGAAREPTVWNWPATPSTAGWPGASSSSPRPIRPG
ncbi:MAG: dTMP kinase [Adlercreutzia sp.]